ncbi:Gp15 family bacteriophage protein [Paenibacillus sp. URB8-2]|uniref:Gp15 family bacteriophage protein n=1 Tax=Paenibacillus sp. URB8-2 TaxID=2741301 RepID=UPI0015B8765D|nr:Gp15 family bacteriophage protein [Paenibacillus sp. URB8-2]BCG57488.1 hypothetical protein PUR_09130 [Paenibacillus sp. URB8-2]
MKRQLPDFAGQPNKADIWYDLNDDWPLIEASLAKQYSIRIRQHGDMPWEEFCSLVAGLMPDTPLGSIVAIRAEKDRKVIKGFSSEQRRIHREWRQRQADSKLASPETLEQAAKSLEAELARMFGGGGATWQEAVQDE